MSDLFGNQNYWFFHEVAQILISKNSNHVDFLIDFTKQMGFCGTIPIKWLVGLVNWDVILELEMHVCKTLCPQLYACP